MSDETERVRERYRQREDELKGLKARLDERDRRLSSARGVAFLAAAGLALTGLFRPSAELWIAAAGAAAVFLFFVVQHARVSTRQFDAERRLDVVGRTLARIEGRYRAPEREAHRRGDAFAATYASERHPYASDLDLFGPASIFEQLNAANTPGGEQRLASWLAAPAPASDVRARQAAARELATLDDFREELAVAGLRAGHLPPSADALIAWAAAPPSLPSRPALAGLAALLFAQLGLGLAAWLTTPSLYRAWLAAVGVQIVVMILLRPRIEPIVGPVTAKQAPLGSYPELMRLCQSRRFEDARLVALRERLASEGGAAEAMARLDGLVGLASVRHNAVGHFIASSLFLWDVWCAALLDRWRRRSGPRIADWIDALAEIEALACIGGFAREHPDFAWPEVRERGPIFEARDLGHPLLPAERRVGNDVVLGGDLRALMITGSNMSGKSTLLRSMGVATVLAQAGAPVCATAMTLSELRVCTSIRVDDSLEQGASRFYAEVRKLKAVVDAADAEGPPVLFLLDEVLHGTNSRERIIGAKAVVAHLVAIGAIGAVSSHDLGLVELEALTAGRVRNVHFEDQIRDGRISFDYHMRTGPVASSNALRLMREVGIEVVPLE